jgi:hypothetical protein
MSNWLDAERTLLRKALDRLDQAAAAMEEGAGEPRFLASAGGPAELAHSSPPGDEERIDPRSFHIRCLICPEADSRRYASQDEADAHFAEEHPTEWPRMRAGFAPAGERSRARTLEAPGGPAKWTPRDEEHIQTIARKARALLPGSEFCNACGRRSGVGFNVPTEVWIAAVPAHYRGGALSEGGLLCIVCFAAFADERLIPWDEEITFHPVSLRTSLHGAGIALLTWPD